MKKKRTKNMKKRVVAGSMAFILAMGMTGTYGYQRYLAQVEAAETDVEQLEEVAENALGDSDTADTEGIYKEESVYVKADPSGKVKNTTVTEWLKNPGQGEVTDLSQLEDIKNIKGEEAFTTGSSNTVSWQSQGDDIYYQGTTRKELPIDVKITYKLDGKEVTAEEFSGKSGKAEIHIEYVNKSKEKVMIDGKEEEIYTPFTMVTAMMLPTDEYKNVTIDSGKIISDADKDIVVGLGFPGLKSNLNLEELEIDLPESITITADVENVSVGPTITVASATLLDEFGLEDVDDFDSFGDSIDELSHASQQLTDGSAQAADGAKQLADGSKDLADGAGTLSSGTKSLAGGTKELASGANTLNSKSGELTSGVNQLALGVNAYAGGVNSLAGGSEQLSAGAEALKEGMLIAQAGIASAKDGADQVVEGCNTVSEGIGSVSGGLDTLSTALEGAAQAAKGISVNISLDGVANDAAAAAYESVVQTLTAGGISQTEAEAYAASISGSVGSAVGASLTNAAQNTTVTGTTELATAIGTAQYVLQQVQSGMSELAAGMGSLAEGAKGLQGGVGTLADKSQDLAAGATDLSDGMNELAVGAAELNKNSSLLLTGTEKLQSGGSQLAAGVSQLAEGANTVAAGADTLNNGAISLKTGTDTLKDGASTLADGNQELADGMKEFKETGIDKIVEIFNGDINTVKERINTMTELGRSYKSFAGIKDGMNGSTKFIIETEGI